MQLEGYSIGGFDRGAPRWKEALWVAVKLCLFLPHLPLPSSFRAALLRAFGARIGRGVVIRGGLDVSYPWRLTIGDHVWLGEEVKILSLATVTIESDVCISQRAFLCTGSHAFRSPDFHLVTKPITIRQGSWIAAQAFVAPGVTIGPGSMVCAGSVVFADVPPDATVQGNPARVRAGSP
jgi:putative colanic acid biosynthesis acetyltransferase WcaF